MRSNKAKLLLVFLCGFSYKLEASSIASGFYIGFGAGMERLNGKRNEWLETDPNSFDPQTFTNNRPSAKGFFVL